MPGDIQPFIGLDVWTMLFAWGNLIILYLFLQKYIIGGLTAGAVKE